MKRDRSDGTETTAETPRPLTRREATIEETARQLNDDGFCVVRFREKGLTERNEEKMARSLLGPECVANADLRALSLLSSGRMAHPTSFHGPHRWVWASFAEEVGISLFAEVELQNTEKTNLKARYLEALPGQVVLKKIRKAGSSPRHIWSFERSALTKKDDSLYVGFINMSKTCVSIDLAKGLHGFPWKTTAKASFVISDPWTVEERGHHVFLAEDSARTAEASRVRVDLAPGEAIIYDARLPVRERYYARRDEIVAKDWDATALLFEFGFRLTYSKEPLVFRENYFESQAVPTLHSGKQPKLFGPIAWRGIDAAALAFLGDWGGTENEGCRTYVRRCTSKMWMAQRGENKDTESVLVPHRVMSSLGEYGLTLHEKYSDYHKSLFRPFVLGPIEHLYLNEKPPPTLDCLAGDLTLDDLPREFYDIDDDPFHNLDDLIDPEELSLDEGKL